MSSVHLLACSRSGSPSSGSCCPLQSPSASQAQGPSLLGTTPEAHLPLPRKPACSSSSPLEPLTMAAGPCRSGKKEASPPGARGRVRGPGTHSSQIPDLAPGRGAWSSPVVCQKQAWPGVRQWGEASNGQPGGKTPGSRAGTPFFKGPGMRSHPLCFLSLEKPPRTGTTWPGGQRETPAGTFCQAAACKESLRPVCWH